MRPATAAELAASLRQADSSEQPIRLGGSFSKDLMDGDRPAQAGVCISTSALNCVLQYEPRDLTIRVEAGMLWSDLSETLRKNGQMIPLDPPFLAKATVGGVLATNASGPRRRLFGTARDHVIGMEFATLEGKLVRSGGMVVKNVAGLDMAKLMIGSFGTLAAIVSANFRLTPIPEQSRTWILRTDSPLLAAQACSELRRSVLQPSALDLVSPSAADRLGLRGWCVLIEAGGIPAVLSRWARDLASNPILSQATTLSESDASRMWSDIREFIPGFVSENPGGAVVRITTALAGITDAVQRYPDAAVLCRAGSGITYCCLDAPETLQRSSDTISEFGPAASRDVDIMPAAFGVMKEIKALFDPKGNLNRGRLYGRI
ncbi:MAG: FAD-binding oxidoreductase [Bryobacteraceae bacterium]|nr:FAD-binding oxidoreductase [Bryobacteraceae bacterium]